VIFTHPDVWSGGYYELAIQLASGALPRAITALWSFADLDGCYAHRDIEPHVQLRIAPSAQHDLFGLARIAAAHVACRSLVIRDESDHDWLHFMLPLGSLKRAFPIGAYPFGDGSNLAWREALDAWLCAIARHVHGQVPFSLAVVGWDVPDNGDIAAVEDMLIRGEILDERWVGYLVARDSSLEWFGPNRGAPMTWSR